jgi:LysR family transcriptional regulator, cys regulon transcriptional activator
MIARDQIDFAIATGSEESFADLTALPCYRWHRAIVVPDGHPLADHGRLTLCALAVYTLVTYSFSFTVTAPASTSTQKQRLPRVCLNRFLPTTQSVT